MRKGGNRMVQCEHRRIKSENCVISCMDCGEILPADYLTARAAQKQAEKPPEAVKAGKGTGRRKNAANG